MSSNIIDNTTGDCNIADLFANKWKLLYNSVGYNMCDMKLLKDELDSDITNMCCQNVCANNHCFTVDEIVESIRQLKKGKHTGKSPLYSDHIIHSSHIFWIYLALLFSAMLSHNFAPQNILMCNIIP